MSADPAITRRLPHRPPALLIETLATGNQGESQAVLQVRADSYYVNDGRLTLAGMVEAMAQAAGVLATGSQEDKGGGVLIGLEELTVRHLPAVGESVRIGCRTIRCLGPARWVHAEAETEGRPSAAGTVKIFLVDKTDS